MNYQNPEKQNKKRKVLKSLTAFVTLLLGCWIIFVAPNSSSQALPNCSDSSISDAQPGLNCHFYGMLLCQAVPSPGYTIEPSRILSSGQSHRVNCADLSDLPLCSQMGSTANGRKPLNPPNPGKNCVEECSNSRFADPNPSAIPANVRGVDYAVHNRDCVRFCDSPETGITANSATNCVARKCHQVATGVTPNSGTNCNILPCNLLTPDELYDNKFEDSSKKYCDGDNVKCYNFLASQLPYTISRGTNTMCKIHDCKPTSSTCGVDDTLNISTKGQAYIDLYVKYISAGFLLDTTAMCNQINCRPVINRQYRCNPFDGENPTTLNNDCDSSGPGATCSGGYCYKTIDCNIASNATEDECINSSDGGSASSGSTSDSMNSWFYRPVPPSKATNGGFIREMESNLCYSQDQMDHVHGWGNHPEVDFGLFTIDLGYFHDYMTMDTRSPGMCNMTEDGSRGNGYAYLCGTGGLVYSKPSEDTAYHKGYVETTFYEGDADNKIVVCLRFNNSMIPARTCGSRECGITCGFGICRNQVCGRDVCKELLVKDANPDECMMKGDIFGSDPDKGCMSTIDGYLRLRAVKYKNRICTYLDVKGQLAYDSMFFDGSEKLSDGTCISGTNKEGTCDDSKNTNDSEGSARQWRTLLRIPYIQNNQVSGPRGYIDRDGRLFREQECIKTPLRIPPPRFYNLANITNSSKLFTPPIYVTNARVKRGGAISIAADGERVGKTDFHYPELEVRFGNTLQKLSLGLGYTGYEVSDGDPLGSQTISTTISAITYSLDIFVRKEFDSISLKPLLCLYRKVQDSGGAFLDPFRIQCVERQLPEINNADARALNPLLDPQKLVIYPDSTNTFNSSKIVLRYLGSFGANNTDNNCSGDDVCTTELKLANPDSGNQNCDSTIETYQVCARREECSKLNVECIQNEIDLQNAKAANQPIDSFLSVRRNCNQILLPICNLKKGLITDPDATIITPNPTGAAVDPKAYGWFNEICISSGFDKKLKTIIAHDLGNGTRGKCLINPLSPYLTDNNSSTNCNEGGKAPNCLCLEVVSGVVEAESGQVERTQTAHEAGLCVDIPIPETCPRVDYNITPNSDLSDPEYVAFSLNNNTYGTAAGTVHISHSYRTAGKPAPNAIPLLGHAEFPLGVMGMNDIEGECKGFWKNAVGSSGVSLFPMNNCLNVGGHAQWDTNVRNQCIRYDCPLITTTGPDNLGIYQGNYGALESGESKGLSNGFATWPQFTKTNDFLESVTATTCITGFKRAGASTNFSAATGNEGNIGNSLTNAAIYGRITGYSGGSLPTRTCNQLGQWNQATNNCQRITCPAINPPTPSGSNDSNAWNLWSNSAGATFPAVNASRSSVRIQQESISTGTCNTSLGFFQSPGGQPPTRACDSLGNWQPVQNPCVTQCDAITTEAASNSNNGFALWNQATDVPLSGEKDGVFNGCVSGYVRYPYPPVKDKYGNPLATEVANDLSRPATNPQRVCKSVITVGGSANVWTGTSSSCINTCPGYNTDPRIGVGKTQHSTSTGTVTIDWPAGTFGTYQYASNVGSWSAADYTQGRTNQRYTMRRWCNSNGAWSAPETLCVANNGQIGNATYNITYITAGMQNSYSAGDSSTLIGSCVSDYWKSNRNANPAPERRCVFESGNNFIDKVYWEMIPNRNDCEQVTCLPFSNQNINNENRGSIYQSTTKTSGTVINGSCNYTANSTTYTNLLVGAPISSTCQNNGTWSTIANLGNCKKPCNVPKLDNRANACGCGNGTGFKFTTEFTLQHGQEIHLIMHDACDGDCESLIYGGNCNDGNFYINDVRGPDCSGGCRDAQYFSSANSFGNLQDIGFPDGVGDDGQNAKGWSGNVGNYSISPTNAYSNPFTFINGNNQSQTISIEVYD